MRYGLRAIYLSVLCTSTFFSATTLASKITIEPIAATENKFKSLFHSFDYHAYVDTSYNDLSKKNIFTSGDYNRVYDIEPDGFTLQQAALTVSKTPDQGAGGILNLIAGRDANRSAPSGWNPYFGSQTLAMYPRNAYLQYTLNHFTLMGGVLDTLLGYEDVESAQDLNFSRSILDDAEPGVHIGLRGRYAITPAAEVFLGMGNGWNTFRQAGRQRLVELGARYQVSPLMTFMVQFNAGPNTVAPDAVYGPTSRFSLLDLVASYQATPHVGLALCGDYYTQQKGVEPDGEEQHVVWQGIAGYVSYQWLERWQVAVRGELFDDQNGYMSGVRQNWREATVTLQYKPDTHVILRAETRRDVSNANAFVNASGKELSNNQQSFAVEGIYIFV